jgi:transcriptional regulator with XRE-family HTH domain
MPPVQDAAIQRRRLRGELQHARKAAGYSQREVAKAMDWSLSKLTRIESGAVGISTTDLRALLGHYGIKDPVKVDLLTEMARASKSEQAWWTEYRDLVSPEFLSFLAFQNAASTIDHFEPGVIPGLLQVEDYITAVLEALGRPAEQANKLVELRLRRQKELFERDNPPEMVFIMDEAALHRWIGGRDVMRQQLEHLRMIPEKHRNVTIEVVPYTAGAHPGMAGPFVILQFSGDDDDDVLFLETFQEDIISRDEQRHLEPARESFARLRDLAATTTLDAIIDKVLKELG